MNKLFIFDLDDTLMDNVHDYSKPILRACEIIIEALGNKAPHVSKIVAMEEEIDKRRIKEINPATGKPYFYSMERFPGSLVETYREICKKVGITPVPFIEERLYTVGLTAFDESRYAANINPSALQVLNFLWRLKLDVLALCTKGDGRVQNKKIVTLKRNLSFRSGPFVIVRIVDEKTPAVFKGIASDVIKWRKDCAVWSVGNSYDSDIAPALAAGFRGIYIPVETWETIGKMDEINSRVDRSCCLIFKNLDQIRERYEELV